MLEASFAECRTPSKKPCRGSVLELGTSMVHKALKAARAPYFASENRDALCVFMFPSVISSVLRMDTKSWFQNDNFEANL